MEREKSVKKASTPATGTATVIVALKNPTGIIIRRFEEVDEYEPVMGGGQRKVTAYRETGERYTLNGNRVPFGQTPNFDIIGGYALTKGIPKDAWEEWKEQNKDSALLQQNLIFAFEKLEDVRSEAVNDKMSKSGMEPIRPGADDRIPKRLNRQGKFVDAIETYNPDN